jgi:hypothetical protein
MTAVFIPGNPETAAIREALGRGDSSGCEAFTVGIPTGRFGTRGSRCGSGGPHRCPTRPCHRVMPATTSARATGSASRSTGSGTHRRVARHVGSPE